MKEDGRKNNGGNKNAGRKPKADEVKLIERLTPLADLAFDALKYGLQNKDSAMIKLYFEYFYGKPKQQMDITSDGKRINLPSWINEDKPES
ncbi:hypothetical protein UFOVP1605_5 [uncultured Caudovirales phage]|uniref:Uncharacterized protein n=1 Tax=uncultured Caudovirales phage TaxID=2100421 RepID=A0A6J5SRF4_9CAUD|nr:hypothetical protein UFOVP1605_5 [uncultured Caudovirales phage]